MSVGSPTAGTWSSSQWRPDNEFETDRQADHMRGLIANLLDAGSIEAGTLTVAPEPANVAALVDRARPTFLSGGMATKVAIFQS